MLMIWLMRSDRDKENLLGPTCIAGRAVRASRLTSSEAAQDHRRHGTAQFSEANCVSLPNPNHQMCVITQLITRWSIFLNIHRRGNNSGDSAQCGLLETAPVAVGKRKRNHCNYVYLADWWKRIYTSISVWEKKCKNSNMRVCSFPVGGSELVTWLLLLLEWRQIGEDCVCLSTF